VLIEKTVFKNTVDLFAQLCKVFDQLAVSDIEAKE